jgi:hypothetical protein
MKRAQCWLALALLIACATMAAHATEVYINATAVTETGSHLAKGTYRLATTQGDPGQTALPSTRGSSSEPVAMYMLVSYVTAPTPWLLNSPVVQRGNSNGNGVGQLIEERGDWEVLARTTIEPAEPVTVADGTFSDVLQFKTVIAGARCTPKDAATFVNGTRYMWLAKGVGLVRMRYEHSDGKVTEAVLLSHSLVTNSNDCLPQQTGNRWTYAWKNALRQESVIETWRIGEQPESLDGPSQRLGSGVGPEIKAVDPSSVTLDPSQDTLLKVSADPKKGFHSPYYLFVPKGIESAADRHLLVEPNNTGTTSDDFQVHDDAAARLVKTSYANRIARDLGTPLLVPVFPRPAEQWQAYTHSLDEDTLLIPSGPLKRIDLQLIQMIQDAQALLRRNHITVGDKVFMHGYSASGVFANRFPVLHPQIVRAIAAGGVNAIPILPLAQWHGTTLPYPVGIADLKKLADIDFDETAYKQVSQYIYMGYLDRNDTTLSRDAFCEEHARLIRELIGAEMPKRWEVSQSIYRELAIPAQCVTYNGSSHEIKPEMIDDIIKFFRANSGSGFVPIQPHAYPFVEFQEIKVAHINGLYWQGDKKIPEGSRKLFGDKDHFIISVNEWMKGQDHQQLTTFRGKAAFRFLLQAPGHDDIQITEMHFKGTCSSGSGEFQGFVVGLPTSVLSKIVSGVEYTIVPVDQGTEYKWQVNDGVRMIRL